MSYNLHWVGVLDKAPWQIAATLFVSGNDYRMHATPPCLFPFFGLLWMHILTPGGHRLYRIGGRAHARGITFESGLARVTAFEDGSKRVKRFSPRTRRIRAAMQKVPFLRVFAALGTYGFVLLALMLALLVLEAFSPGATDFVPNRVFWTFVFVLGVALVVALLATRGARRRLLQYHGAEHMAINTYRAGKPLTAENIARADRATPSCGSVLVLIFLLISVPLWFVPYGDYFMILALGIAFEISILARRAKGLRWLLRFGMAVQRKIWTRPPDAAQVELARRGLSALVALMDAESKGA